MVLKIRLTLLGVLAIASISEAGMTIDYKYYCSRELECKNRISHVMCSYPTSWTSNCKSPRFIPLNNALKQLFLDNHNMRRNMIALGKLPGKFEGRQAVDMAEISWDDELEMIAQKNLIKCKLEHDKCRRTKKFIWAGQNLGLYCIQPYITTEKAIKLIQDDWWNEYKNIRSIDKSNSYSSIKASDQFGHFTQMARDKAFAMGCAVTSTENGYCHTVACNYAVTNWGYDSVYVTGTLRSKCKTYSQKYPGLCSDREDYTKYTRFGVSFFTNDSSTVPPLLQWIANDRVLLDGTGPSMRRNAIESKQAKNKQPMEDHPSTSSVKGKGPKSSSIKTQLQRIATTVKRSVPITTRRFNVSFGTMNDLDDIEKMFANMRH